MSAPHRGRRRYWLRLGLLQIEPRVPYVLQAASHVLRKTASGESFRTRWHDVIERRPVGFLVEHGSQRVRHRVSTEGAPAGQALVQAATEGPDVAAPIDRLPTRLLRAHVSRRPEKTAFARRLDRCR